MIGNNALKSRKKNDELQQDDIMTNEITDALVNLEEDKTLGLVKQAVTTIDPLKIIDSLRDAMTIVGQKFAVKEYYLTDMVYAAEIFHLSMEIIEPHLKTTGEVLGKVLIGTAQSDIHDIGKNIVASLLKCAGFQVIDLGVDVAPETFLSKIKEHKPDVVGLSGLLTTSFEPMKVTIDLMEKEGVRSDVRVIVGGGPVNKEWAEKVKADAFAKDAVEGVALVRQFCG
ncbi:MAG: cobalamin-binding protein [Promethearchaeota archaeon]|nr:MAG: cobalamin-binding protein [Candidatus Lokiarchaeota archaeon]